VQAGLPAPPLEGEERALAAQVREDQLAVDVLLRRQRLVDALEAREPLLAEGATGREAGGREVTEPVIMLMDSRNGRGDGLEREAVVDELPHQLDERVAHGRR